MSGCNSGYRPFPAALWQMVVIVLLGSAIGLAFNWARAGGIPLVGSKRILKFDTAVAAAPARQAAEVDPSVNVADPAAADEVPAETVPPAAATDTRPAVTPPAAEPDHGGSGGVEVFSALPVEEAPQEGGDSGPMALDLAQALELFEEGAAVFVDARMPDEFTAGHIPGALNLPYDELEAHLDVLNYLPDDRLVITYCDGSECAASLELADELTAMGFGQLRVFFGGWEQWIEAGHPAEEGEALLPY